MTLTKFMARSTWVACASELGKLLKCHLKEKAVDDPMNCCPRPSASGNSSSGHLQHLGVTVLTVTQEGMKYLYTV